MITGINLYGQEGFYEQEGFGVYYGISVTQFHTGSGHGSSYVMNTNVQKGRKSLELGMVFEEENERISGGNAKYKVFLGKNAFIENIHHAHSFISVKPYLYHNCIYHSSVVNTPDFTPPSGKKSTFPELPSSPGTIASMEHYAGLGLELFIAKNISIDGSMGFGTYIGSVDKYKSPSTFGIHNDNYGFVLAFEFGFGYTFGM